MQKKYLSLLVFICLVLPLSPTKVVAQAIQKDVTIKSIVQDENGNPVKGATIYGNEGTIVAKTDESGHFTISIPGRTDLLVEADDHESKLFKAEELTVLKEFQIKTTQFRYGINDDVNIAFSKTKKGDLVNAVSVIEPDEIMQYDNVQSIGEALNGRVPGLYGSSNIRGIGTALFIVDGLPRDISTINLSEVDQITVLKDINASILYGSAAVNGVILLTTKRGQPYKKQIRVSGYYGISKPTALPKYLSSADYMKLNNEARVNDGLAAQYDSATISNYTIGNRYRYPSVDYYSNEYLKSVKSFYRVSTELSGGNNVAAYYANLGWDRTGSLLDFGEGRNANQNKFNVRGNVDLKINNFITASLDAVGIFDNRKNPVGNYWSSAATVQPQLFAPLIPFNLIVHNDPTLAARKNDVDGIYLLGGSSSYLTNEIANGYSGGVTENVQRTFNLSNKIDFDLNRIVQGLTFHTNISFDLYNRYDQSITNKYSVYSPTWNATGDSISSLTRYGTDARSGSQDIGNAYYARRFGFYGKLNYDRTFRDVHHVTGTLAGYGNRYKVQGDFQGTKDANLSLRLTYVNNKKYLVDFSNAYVNSVKLPAGNRTAFSPSLGLAWVISKENFLSSVTAIDYLKLRISAGIMNSDNGIDGFYYYDNIFRNSGSFGWYEGTYSNSGVISSNGSNLNLFFEKRKELNFGFEGSLFNRVIEVDANLFTSVYSDQIVRPTSLYPSFFSTFIPYQNIESTAYRGAELGLTFNKSFGNLSLVVGANAMYANSEVLKKDEIYANKYQNRVGRPLDALFGLVADGLFQSTAETKSSDPQVFGVVKPGDIKYVDQNNDHIIDQNDEVQIGRWQAPFTYGLNVKLTYKNFTIFAKGTGNIGADSYISGNYYWVDGNDKYSEYILDRWTPTNTDATYPRLSSIANQNNFRNSTFWLYKDNIFRLGRVQLTYTLSDAVTNKLQMKHLSFYVDGSNLLTVSKHREIKELVVGSEPSYRSFSFGVKTMF